MTDTPKKPLINRQLAVFVAAISLGFFTLPFPGVGGQLRAWLGAKAPFLMTVLGSLALVPAWTKLIPLEGEREQELVGVTDIQK